MKVLVSGGGTGGHIYPALSIIRKIQQEQPDAEFLYIGTENGLEKEIVTQTDIPFETISISGFRRKLSLENVKTVVRFLKGVGDSKQKIRAFDPDIVIGTGGYVCGPVVYAASRLNIPTLVHEQNIVPGLTNVFLSRYTDAVAISFPGSRRHFKHSNIVLTGNPRASEVVEADGEAGRRSLEIDQHKKVILIVGGSRGAKSINDAFLEMASKVDRFPADCHFVYVTGEVHYEHIQKEMEQLRAPQDRITLKPFLYNMPDVLAGTDMIVNRAGASFLSEITALGLPSILIPSPYVTNNHQEKNARWLEEEGASRVILEKELDGEALFEHLQMLMQDEQQLQAMRKASLRLGQRDASAQIYHLILDLINKK